MKKQPEFNFEASAYLQTLLGRELIRSEELALIELIKNSYDSGARSVLITIRPPSPKEPGEITILDDGRGMGLNEFQQSYMFAGFSNKTTRARRSGRIQTGEKGIGRFASDRLGATLTVITKPKASRLALRVEIDWAKFSDRSKRFNDVHVPYHEEQAPAALGSSGTLLTIGRLRETWDRPSIEGLRRALTQLLDPYMGPSGFKIDLQVPNSPALSGRILRPKVEDADIEISFRINDHGQVTRERNGLRYAAAPLTTTYTPTAFDSSYLRGLQGRLCYFLDRPRKTSARGLSPGVSLYRDGFRIEPMGSGKADWLGIEEKRAKRAGHAHIVPTRLFGFVNVSRITNPEIKDTTSREALIDSPEVQALFSALKEQLRFLEDSIQTDVAEPRWKKNRSRQAVALEQARLQSLSILSAGLGHELRQPLQAIRMDADNIRIRLTQLEIEDADITDAQQSIDKAIARIDNNINLIASIASGNIDESVQINVADVISKQLTFLRNRCSAEGIDLVVRIPSNILALSNETLVGMVLINLVQNSIDALVDVSDDRVKLIDVSVSGESAVSVSISVADNANGVPESIKSKVFRRFTTQKTGGWGVGLYNCRAFLESHGGRISFVSREGKGTTFNFTLPKVVS